MGTKNALAGTKPLGTDISETRFINCRWPLRDGYMYLPEHSTVMASGDVKKLARMEGLYRALKSNLENAKEYRQAGDFHFREMQIKQARLGLEATTPAPPNYTKSAQHNWRQRLILWLYWATSDFGENWRSLLIAMGVTWIITSATIASTSYAAPLKNCADMGISVGIQDGLFMAIIGILPFATSRSVGLECLSGFAKGIIAFEGITLLVLTTLFLMALRRDFRR